MADLSRYGKLKRAVMSKYGGRCVVCGATELAVLTLDHIHDDGAEDRRQQGHDGVNLYRALRDKPRRDDLQVLCSNCNFRKRNYGPDPACWPICRCPVCGGVRHLDDPQPAEEV